MPRTLTDSSDSIAKYTGDYSHLQKFNPIIPEPFDPDTQMEEIFGSAKQYFEQVADSMSPPQSNRLPGARSTGDMEGLQKVTSRHSAPSRASTMMLPLMEDSPVDEPRIFPGILHETEKRRSRRISTAGFTSSEADGASMDTITPGLASLAVTEQEEIRQDEESD